MAIVTEKTSTVIVARYYYSLDSELNLFRAIEKVPRNEKRAFSHRAFRR